jgi:hypothetical protein
MDSRINRPVSVCVAQGLLIFFSLLLLLALSTSLTIFSMEFREGMPITGLMYVHSVMGGLVLLFLLAFRGLVKRKMYGKWLAVLSLIFFWSLLIHETLRPSLGSHNYFEHKTFWWFIGETTLEVLLHGGFLFLILHLAFSKNVNCFFRQETLLIRKQSCGDGLH